MSISVFWNGKPLSVETARTSRIPFNRVWPGHQRELGQTEISYFVNFDMEGAGILRVETDEPVKKAEVRPLKQKIPHRVVCGNVIEIDVKEPMQFTVEPDGFLGALAVFANPVHEPYEIDENTLYFGAGEHEIGVLMPKSGQTVILDEGAVLYGSIILMNVENVTLKGRGILDGSRLGRSTSTEDAAVENLFVAYASRHIRVEGIILRDSPMWCFILRNGCEDVTVRNVKLIGLWRYNSDGFDICTSKNVTVEKCFVRSFDDCLVARGVHLTGEEGGGCENVTFRDCVLWCDWGKNMEVWSGMYDSTIRNVVFDNNACIRVAQTAMSVDTWYGSREIVVDGVSFRNCSIEGDEHPLIPEFQKEDGEEYVVKDRKHERLALRIIASKLGRNTGNQSVDPNVDLSAFHVRYRNIEVRNVTFEGKKDFDVLIDKTNLTECENIRIIDTDI